MKHGVDCDCAHKRQCEDAEKFELHGTVRGRRIVNNVPAMIGPTTNAERFSALRSNIESATRRDERALLLIAVADDLRELEAIVRSADDVLQATTANTKHAARNELYARLRKWRRWPEPEQVT